MEILVKYGFFVLSGIYFVCQFLELNDLAFIVFMVALLDLANVMSKKED